MMIASQLVALLDGFGLAVTLPIGLVVTAFGFGVRHGFDWDHIAAISDLSGSAESRRRGLALSMMYALGHAAAVLVLGLIIVVIGSSIPDQVADPLERWMGRVVGFTLVALGLWILIELVRKGRDFRLRSRWMLVLQGTFAGVRRVHRSLDPRTRKTVRHLEVEHEHPHPHDDVDPSGGSTHDDVQAHDHAHMAEPAAVAAEPVAALSEASVGSLGHSHATHDIDLGQSEVDSHSHGHSLSDSHSHRHRHKMALGDLGGGTAVGVGVLHGVGVESPTQIALFTASASVGQGWAALALLVAWVCGLVVANGVLAVVAGFGLLQAERYFAVYATVAVLVALLSIAMGGALIADVALPLP